MSVVQGHEKEASTVVDQRSKAFEAAHRAFWQGGPPGVLRRLQNVDSYPGERVAPDDPPDPEAHQLLPTSVKDERQALADAIAAYLDAVEGGGAAL